VVLAPAAQRVIIDLPDAKRLADALQTELANSPNASREVRFDSSLTNPGNGDGAYTATPLSADGYTAIHRPLIRAEIERLETQLGRPTEGWGYYVIDLLPAESAFRRWPRLA
jgi:hypothetical protein